MSPALHDATDSEAFFTAILQASNLGQLQLHVRKVLATMSLDEVAVRTSIDASCGDARHHWFGTFPDLILKQFERSDRGGDPVDTHFLKSGLPLTWEPKDFCCSKQTTYVKLIEQGMRWGMSVLIRGERTTSRIDFYARHIPADPISVKLAANLQLLGLYLHEVTQSLVQLKEQIQLPHLTPREKECLYWTASGKTNQEVGMILGISSHTASFHLKNVAAKLNVYGTRHAITRAIALGIIQPKRASQSEID